MNRYLDTRAEVLRSLAANMEQRRAHSQDVIIVSEEDVDKEMTDIMDDIGKIVYLPRQELRVLLHHYDWRRNNILDDLKKNEKETLTQAGLGLTDKEFSVFKITLPTFKNGSCEICLKDGYFWHHCQHLICDNCWFQYLKIEITEKRNCIKLECPTPGCNFILGESFILEIF